MGQMQSMDRMTHVVYVRSHHTSGPVRSLHEFGRPSTVMTTSNSDIVHEGWLTKSPPSKRVWKPKWRRRWFSLRQSKDFPGQYILDYYADKNSLKPKGSINLDCCEQVDAGLRMQRRNCENATTKATVFSIRTTSRTYHLEADCVTEMEKWVEVICRACGLRPTDEEKNNAETNLIQRVPPVQTVSGPYIPISECITGKPNRQDGDMRIFSFPTASRAQYLASISEDSSPSINDASNKSITPSEFNQSSSLSKYNGTPAPPRPPKPPHMSVDTSHKESFVGPRLDEPKEGTSKRVQESNPDALPDMLHELPQYSQQANVNNGSLTDKGVLDHNDHNSTSQGYYMFIAPAVNRELKPEHLRARAFRLKYNESTYSNSPNPNASKLQYIDLDLVTPSSDSASPHFKSRLALGSSTIYKTVDFIKTEALNIIRIDTEACRRNDASHH